MKLHIQRVQRIIESIRVRGLVHTARLLSDYWFFDLRHGTETKEPILLRELQIDSLNKSLGKRYNPTLSPLLLEALKYVDSQVYQGSFIDFGCGKGRILIAAAKCNFKKVIGIEFSKELYEVCKRNIAKLDLRNAEVLFMDAANYGIPPDAQVLFFFYPFEHEVLQVVLQNIESSLNENWRDCYVIYVEPAGDESFPENRYQLIQTMKSPLGRDVNIYKIVPSTD